MIRPLAIAATLLWIAACSQPSRAPGTQTAVIGVSLPVAGSQGGNGLMALHAIELAVDEVNAASPALHLAIELKDTSRGGFVNPHEDEGRDTTLDAPNGAQDMRAFAADPRVLAVIGPMTSDVARAEIPIARRAGLALISASARESGITQTPSTFFRSCPSRDDDARAAAQAATALKARRIFLVSARDEHATELARVFLGEFQRRGGAVVARATLDAATFERMVSAVDAARPDLVVFAGPEPTNVLLMRPSAARRVLSPSRLAYMENPGYLSPISDEYYTIWEGDVTAGARAAFRNAFRSRFGVAPPLVAAYYYAAAQTLSQAIESEEQTRGMLPTRADVVETLRRAEGFATIFGATTFDHHGDLKAARLAVVRVSGNRYSTVREEIVGRD